MRAKNERVLFLSVIEAAVQDAKGTNVRVRRAAIEWLMQDEVDFPHICELAGVEVEYLRRSLSSCASFAPWPAKVQTPPTMALSQFMPICDAVPSQSQPSSDAAPCYGTLGT